MKRSSFYLKFIGALLLSMLLVCIAQIAPVSAHAKIVDSDPKMGSTVAEVPTKVTVTAAENMKPGAKFSNLEVYGPDGEKVSQGDATVATANPKQMSVAIKGEDKGTYIVRWTNVSSDDNDADSGAFVFTVGTAPSASVSTNQQAPAPTRADATSASGVPIWVPIVVGVLALLVGASLGMGLGRSRAAANLADGGEAVNEKQEITKS